jgi:hypothetical protein
MFAKRNKKPARLGAIAGQAYFNSFRCFEDVVAFERMFPQGSYDFLLSGILSINLL